MKIALAAFGLFAIYLGVGATVLAIKSGEIASLLIGGSRAEASREKDPLGFWSGVALYGLVSVGGLVALIGAIVT